MNSENEIVACAHCKNETFSFIRYPDYTVTKCTKCGNESFRTSVGSKTALDKYNIDNIPWSEKDDLTTVRQKNEKLVSLWNGATQMWVREIEERCERERQISALREKLCAN